MKKFVEHYLVQFSVGVVLLVSVFTDYLGINHGIFAMGVWHLLQTTPNMLQALERITKGKIK